MTDRIAPTDTEGHAAAPSAPGAQIPAPGTGASPAPVTATALLAAYRAGTLSPVDATRDALARIEATEPAVNAFVRVDAEAALAQAGESARRWERGEPAGLLDGVPVTVKDILLQRGGPTFKGSRTVRAAGRGRRTRPRWRGCGSTGRSSSARRRRRSSAGRA